MVNKTKRGLGLGAGIASIVVGAGVLISSIIALATINGIRTIAGVTTGLNVVFLIVILLLGITSIVLGAMLCRKPKETAFGFNYFKGIKISLLVILAILFVLEILAVGGILMILDLIIIAAIIGLLIASLCIKDNNVQAIENSETTASHENIANEQDLIVMRDLGILSDKEVEQKKKIAQIEDLKNRGLLSKEQVEMAVSKILFEQENAPVKEEAVKKNSK